MTHNAGGGGIGTEGDPFTLLQAADAVAADDLVNVKATGEYIVQDGANDCILHIDQAGSGAAGIVWEGYTTNPGDGGVVTLNAGTNTLASAVKTAIGGSVYNTFRNFRLTGGSGDNADLNGVTDDYTIWENCRFDNAGGWGVQGDNYHIFYKCTFDNNTSGGADFGASTLFIGCIGHTVGLMRGEHNCLAIFSDFYNNGAGASNLFLNNNFGFAGAINCSFDGDANATSEGIDFVDNDGYGYIAINNIFYDLLRGVNRDAIAYGNQLCDYNLWFSNVGGAVLYNNITGRGNDVAGSEDPFNASGSRDYRLKAASEALKVGFDAGEI